MTGTTKTTSDDIAAMRRDIQELRMFMLPLCTGSLQSLAALQESLCKSAQRVLEPERRWLDKIVERMGEDISASIARDILTAVEVRLEPFLPLLMVLAQRHGLVPANADAPKVAT